MSAAPEPSARERHELPPGKRARLNVYIRPETLRACRMMAASQGATIALTVDELLRYALTKSGYPPATTDKGEDP